MALLQLRVPPNEKVYEVYSNELFHALLHQRENGTFLPERKLEIYTFPEIGWQPIRLKDLYEVLERFEGTPLLPDSVDPDPVIDTEL